MYANVINYEDEGSEIYAHYREEMESFAWRQLERRHINAHLRTIYKRFISEKELNPERVKALYDICYSYEVKTKVHNIKFIYVIARDGKELHMRVPYSEQGH